MGDIAEMMLDGTLCQECGAYIKTKADGFPRTCHYCQGENRKSAAPKVKCTICGKNVKAAGLIDHKRVVHKLEAGK